MKFFAILVALVILDLVVIRADAQIDLGGTWEFEKSTSIFISPKTYQSRVVIDQHADNVVIFTKSRLERIDIVSGKPTTLFDEESTLTYFLDGRGEVNTLRRSNVYSKTEWKKDKLAVTFFSGPENEKKRKTLGKVEFSLSKDGKQLLMTKKGKPDDSIPIGYAPPTSQEDVMAMLIVKGSLANRKDTFRLVSK